MNKQALLTKTAEQFDMVRKLTEIKEVGNKADREHENNLRLCWSWMNS